MTCKVFVSAVIGDSTFITDLIVGPLMTLANLSWTATKITSQISNLLFLPAFSLRDIWTKNFCNRIFVTWQENYKFYSATVKTLLLALGVESRKKVS